MTAGGGGGRQGEQVYVRCIAGKGGIERVMVISPSQHEIARQLQRVAIHLE